MARSDAKLFGKAVGYSVREVPTDVVRLLIKAPRRRAAKADIREQLADVEEQEQEQREAEEEYAALLAAYCCEDCDGPREQWLTWNEFWAVH